MSNIDHVLDIMAKLRDPQAGCPWDRKQTYESIIPHTIEEVYEVLDAIERRNLHDLRDELGDLLFQVVFLSRIAEEAGAFNFDGVAFALKEKLIRRHPHVFGDAVYADEGELAKAWDQHKELERRAKDDSSAAQASPSPLDGVAHALPALLRAHKLQSRAGKVGFDWPDRKGVLAKLREELAELEDELTSEPDLDRVGQELGDVLFTCVNLARHLRLDAEASLRAANERFVARFRAMEGINATTGRPLSDLTPNEWESLWAQAKVATDRRPQGRDRDPSSS